MVHMVKVFEDGRKEPMAVPAGVMEKYAREQMQNFDDAPPHIRAEARERNARIVREAHPMIWFGDTTGTT